MIIFIRTQEAGFLAGDTETGFTAYAYPTSTHAVAAKRSPSHRAAIAKEMIANETAARRIVVSPKLAHEIAWQDSEHMKALRFEHRFFGAQSVA